MDEKEEEEEEEEEERVEVDTTGWLGNKSGEFNSLAMKDEAEVSAEEADEEALETMEV